MVGRPKETKLKNIENRIRTITWFKCVLSSSGAKNTNQLVNLVDRDLEGLRKLSNYSTGKNIPSRATLKLIDNIFPSTQEVFDQGPCQSFLFEAMGGDIDLLIDDIETSVNSFVWLSPITHEISFYKIQDAELKEIIKLLEQFYLENKVGGSFGDTPESFLIFLSGCIILLRFSIQRDFHHMNSDVEDILNIIFHILKKPDVESTLTFFSIKTLFLEWLYHLIKGWCEVSVAGERLQMADMFPPLDEFVMSPHIFHKMLLEAYLEVALDYSGEKEYIAYINDLVTRDKKKWFERYQAN